MGDSTLARSSKVSQIRQRKVIAAATCQNGSQSVGKYEQHGNTGVGSHVRLLALCDAVQERLRASSGGEVPKDVDS
jgi:hypothetical protein